MLLGVSGPLLCMADMSPFWFCIYLNGIWKSGGENRTVCEVHTALLLTCGSGPLHMHGSYESNFNIRINFKIINFDINL
jgi:hypothetical protein